MAHWIHVERAEKAFQAFLVLKEKKLFEDAFSRGYYALLHLGFSLLLKHGHSLPKTHAGFIAKLWELKEELGVPASWVQQLSRFQSLREGGNYAPISPLKPSDLDSLDKLYHQPHETVSSA